MEQPSRTRRCGWCNGWLTLSSDVLACPHPGGLAETPPRPKTPPMILDAVPPPSPLEHLRARSSQPMPSPQLHVIRRGAYRLRG